MVHKKDKIRLMLKNYRFVEMRQKHIYRVGYEYYDGNKVRRVNILDHIMRVIVLSKGNGLGIRHIHLVLDYDKDWGGLFCFFNEAFNPIKNKRIREDAKIKLEEKIRDLK